MKEKLRKNLILIFAGMLSLFVSTNAKSQTAGTLTFTFNQIAGSYTKNVMAVWIETNSGTFVKTKMRYWGSNTNDHLPSWVSKSSQNVVDATTGATLRATTNPTAFGVKTVTWNGTNVANAVVADGDYKIFVETATSNPEPGNGQHTAIVSYDFTKGALFHSTPAAGNVNFSGITIDWVPTVSSVSNIVSDKNISVYPNPSKGLVKLDFKNSISVSRILVENIYGEVVYQETTNKEISGIKTLNLQQLSNGIYFVEILATDKTNSYKTKIVINK